LDGADKWMVQISISGFQTASVDEPQTDTQPVVISSVVGCTHKLVLLTAARRLEAFSPPNMSIAHANGTADIFYQAP